MHSFNIIKVETSKCGWNICNRYSILSLTPRILKTNIYHTEARTLSTNIKIKKEKSSRTLPPSPSTPFISFGNGDLLADQKDLQLNLRLNKTLKHTGEKRRVKIVKNL